MYTSDACQKDFVFFLPITGKGAKWAPNRRLAAGGDSGPGTPGGGFGVPGGLFGHGAHLPRELPERRGLFAGRNGLRRRCPLIVSTCRGERIAARLGAARQGGCMLRSLDVRGLLDRNDPPPLGAAPAVGVARVVRPVARRHHRRPELAGARPAADRHAAHHRPFGEDGHLRRQRRDAARVLHGEPHHRAAGPHPAGAAAGGGLGRGQALLQPLRHRPAARGRRHLDQPHLEEQPGRQHAHAAAGAQPLPQAAAQREAHDAQVPRVDRRGADRVPLHEGRDPRDVPQPDLPGQGRLRRAGRRAHRSSAATSGTWARPSARCSPA